MNYKRGDKITISGRVTAIEHLQGEEVVNVLIESGGNEAWFRPDHLALVVEPESEDFAHETKAKAVKK